MLPKNVGDSIIARVPEDSYFEDYCDGIKYNDSYKDFGFDLFQLKSDLGRHSIRPQTILDAGCATGMTVRDLREEGFDAWGIEANEYAYKQTPFEVRDFCKHGDIRELSNYYPPDRFDCIFCNSMMYLNKEEVIQTLFEFHTVAKKCIYIVVPVLDEPYTVVEDKYREFLQEKKWWKTIIELSGFEYMPDTDMLFTKI